MTGNGNVFKKSGDGCRWGSEDRERKRWFERASE
jgi:hypothetical protein